MDKITSDKKSAEPTAPLDIIMTPLYVIAEFVFVYLVFRYFSATFAMIEQYICYLIHIFTGSSVYYVDFNWVANVSCFFWILITAVLISISVHSLFKRVK